MPITPVRIVALLVAGVFVFGAYAHHSRRVAAHREYQMELAEADRGNPVLVNGRYTIRERNSRAADVTTHAESLWRAQI
jgi:hypothetical protein